MASSAAVTFLLLLSFCPLYSFSAIHRDFVTPNLTISNFGFIDQSGAFLTSLNKTFTAAVAKPNPGSISFYLLVTHSDSGAVVWAANRSRPISNSGRVELDTSGLAIFDDSGVRIWTTPPLRAKVGSLQLQDSGNLVLLDDSRVVLWESFDYPTDTIVSGQRLQFGASLIAATNDVNLSAGSYGFTLTGGDAAMQWNNLTYWKLSMSTGAFKISDGPVNYMAVNDSGLYLFGNQGSEIVIQVALPAAQSDLRIAKMGSDGHFTVMRFVNKNWVTEYSRPDDSCGIPFICGRIRLCSAGVCSCPPRFHNDNGGGCMPANSSLSLPSSCSGNINAAQFNSSRDYSYISLGAGMDYFSNSFTQPQLNGVSLSVCEDTCSENCSCLGVFYGNLSGSCYLLENNLGSLQLSSSGGSNRLGYIKAIVISSPSSNPNDEDKSNFPIVGLVLLPSSAVFLIFIVVGLLWMRRRRRIKKKSRGKSLGRIVSSSSTELEDFSIPGLPVRFDHQEIVEATENFRTRIGSGGFGTVYKGELKDNTTVAVKKITCMGSQGKREFATEITIIGNIHHVNLVKLRGFCTHGRDRFLVYEYMNRGSLDRTLFGPGPILEWRERFEIALGTARGLAYLHSGCDHKIIHCDVKPENILLHDNMLVKISDFGLSKLLSPEQSGLFTTMRGTRGYLAPEWLTNSAISDKTDVYSYGMVLLELVSGRKNCALQTTSRVSENCNNNNNSSEESSTLSASDPRQCRVYFPLLALEMHGEGRYLELVERRLEGRVTSEEVEKVVKIALCCVHEEPSLRPTMANVVGMLEGVLPLGEPRMESLNILRFYGRRFTEESTRGGRGEDIEENVFRIFPQAYAGDISSTNALPDSFSYLSSQQVSGPR